MRRFGSQFGWPLLCAALLTATPAFAARLTGINLAGGEFGGPKAQYGFGYVYPDRGQINAFAALGMNVFRVPIRWERVVTRPGSPLIEVEMKRIDAVIQAAAARNASIIIDLHNYGRFRGQPIGSPAVPVASLVDLWTQLAVRYRGNRSVVFGLMNEPVHINAAAWAAVAQKLVDAIRARGADNLILVPGAYWSGAHSWRKQVAGPSNAEALGGLRDPGRNMAFDFHQYFDPNSSGQSTRCVNEAEAIRRIGVASSWLAETDNRGFLSEFGVARSPECLAILKAVVANLNGDDHWLGWTIWASAQWFGTYAFNLYPDTGPPQLTVLQPFLARAPGN